MEPTRGREAAVELGTWKGVALEAEIKMSINCLSSVLSSPCEFILSESVVQRSLNRKINTNK